MKRRRDQDDGDETKTNDRNVRPRGGPLDVEARPVLFNVPPEVVSMVLESFPDDEMTSTLSSLKENVNDLIPRLTLDIGSLANFSDQVPRVHTLTISNMSVPSAMVGMIEEELETRMPDDEDAVERLQQRRDAALRASLKNNNRWLISFSFFPALRKVVMPFEVVTGTFASTVDVIRGLVDTHSAVRELHCCLDKAYNVEEDDDLAVYKEDVFDAVQGFERRLFSMETLAGELQTYVSKMNSLQSLVLVARHSCSTQPQLLAFMNAPNLVTLHVRDYLFPYDHERRLRIDWRDLRGPMSQKLQTVIIEGATQGWRHSGGMHFKMYDRDCGMLDNLRGLTSLSKLHLRFTDTDNLCANATLQGLPSSVVDLALQFKTANRITESAFEPFMGLRRLVLGGVWRKLNADILLRYLGDLRELKLLGCHVRISHRAFEALHDLQSLTISCCSRAYLTPAALTTLRLLVQRGGLRHIHWVCCASTACARQRLRSCCFDANFSKEDIEAVFTTDALPGAFAMTMEPCERWSLFHGDHSHNGQPRSTPDCLLFFEESQYGRGFHGRRADHDHGEEGGPPLFGEDLFYSWYCRPRNTVRVNLRDGF